MERITIAVISDTHVAERATAFNSNLRVVFAWIRDNAPDLVVHLGDITADGMYDIAELDFAADLLGELNHPMHVLPGNHDIGDPPLEPGELSRHPLTAERMECFRRALGADRWTLCAPGWQIVGLNALLLGAGSAEEEEQFSWLETQVSASREQLGIMLHKPLFRDSPLERNAHERYVPWRARERLLKLLARRKLRFVVSGHTHQARRCQSGSVEHLWVPSTAFWIPDALQEPIGEKRVGFALLELDPNGHRMQWVTPAGLVAHNLLDYAEIYPQIKDLALPHGDGDQPR